MGRRARRGALLLSVAEYAAALSQQLARMPAGTLGQRGQRAAGAPAAEAIENGARGDRWPHVARARA